MFVLLLVAGFETTAGLLGNALTLAFQHSLAAHELRTGAIPAARFVDEVLRRGTPIQYGARLPLTEGLDVGGVPAHLGTVALVFLGAANRDPSRYDRPAEFDPLRTDPQPLAFGGGAHFCPGAPLAGGGHRTARPAEALPWAAAGRDTRRAGRAHAARSRGTTRCPRLRFAPPFPTPLVPVTHRHPNRTQAGITPRARLRG